MPLYLMLDAFNPILAKEVLEAQDLLATLPPLLMFSLLFLFSCSRCSSSSHVLAALPCVSQPAIAGIMQAVSRMLECYFQRRKLGAANYISSRGDNSGAILNGLPIDSTCTLRPLRKRAAL